MNMPKITVKLPDNWALLNRTEFNDMPPYSVNGQYPIYALSRVLTDTASETENGIFSMGGRGICFVCADGDGIQHTAAFPSRPAIHTGMSAKEVEYEITERVRIVREWVDNCQHPKQPASSDPQLPWIASCIDRLQSLADEMDEQIATIRKITSLR